MIVLYLVLLVVALVCFVLASLGVAARRINLVALGLSFVTLVWVLQTMQKV